MELLKVENLTKKYGTNKNEVTALNNISFSVEEGEFVSIVGTSRKWKINTFTFNWWRGQAFIWKSIYKRKRYLFINK